mmetsp:Transcript_98704/g.282176  ORF Transcript_98704/g.282176 Transcript_98704/m.282176 type:complete len:228 (-) Transcript_98704:795-1478(-)
MNGARATSPRPHECTDVTPTPHRRHWNERKFWCLLVLEVLDRVDEALGVRLRGLGLDTVTKVHDVVLATGHLQDLLCALLDLVVRTHEHRRVEVALHTDVGAKAAHGLIHGHRPVNGNNVSTRLSHALQEGARLLDVDDDRDVRVLRLDLGDHLLLVREGKLVVVARREVAGPRVEDLDNLSTIIDLVARVLADVVAEGLEHLVKELRVGKAHLLDLEVLPRRLALH